MFPIYWRTDPWSLGFKTDPGPCPVDDTPHTCCTPESVAAKKRAPEVTVAIATPAPAPPVTFTTSSYRRKLHGPKVK